jgi:hypothetical protein
MRPSCNLTGLRSTSGCMIAPGSVLAGWRERVTPAKAGQGPLVSRDREVARLRELGARSGRPVGAGSACRPIRSPCKKRGALYAVTQFVPKK